MGALYNRMTTPFGRAVFAIFAAAAIAWPVFTGPAMARGPDAIADVAEQVIDAVVNISTKQTVDIANGAIPQLPPGSPFEEFFEEFFKNRRGPGGQGGHGGQNGQNGQPQARPFFQLPRPADQLSNSTYAGANRRLRAVSSSVAKC